LYINIRNPHFGWIVDFGQTAVGFFSFSPSPAANRLYLHVFDNGRQLRDGLNEWFRFYNQERFHQALDNLTPDEVYYDLPHPFAEAA
jgi:transposase InsO family protein